MKNPRQKPLFLSILAISLSTCFGQNELSNTAAVTPEVVEIRVTDWSGHITPPHAVSRRPVIEVEFSTAIDPSDQPVFLLSGRLDPQLTADLRTRPLRAENSERVISSEIIDEEILITLIPLQALEASASYTLVVAGWAKTKTGTKLYKDGSGFSIELKVSECADAGARVDASWPADASSGVAPNLAFAALHFDGEIAGERTAISLENMNGDRVPAKIERQACAQIGWNDGVCVVLEPEADLEPNARYNIVIDETLRDARGAPLGAQSFAFDTASEKDLTSPEMLSHACAIDESTTAVGCALIDDRDLWLNLRANEAVRIALRVFERSIAKTAPRGEAIVALEAEEAGSTLPIELTATDEAGNRYVTSISISLETELARLSITEVRADPRGPEPAQEFIELLNYGETPVDLAGFYISDSLDDLGDAVARSEILFPGTRALLVSDDFNPDEPQDEAPPSGAVLVRVGASLTRSGLSNAGEAIFLRDPAGRRVSAAPATPRPRPGVCITRVSENMRDGSPRSFVYDSKQSCSPGR
ncbi:MAG: lamin tail domain-containing protein [Deltaproteobacteria bacterium]|nr:lamin tail domain-containing protein [Deltaproteobacteria bacterium]